MIEKLLLSYNVKRYKCVYGYELFTSLRTPGKMMRNAVKIVPKTRQVVIICTSPVTGVRLL